MSQPTAADRNPMGNLKALSGAASKRNTAEIYDGRYKKLNNTSKPGGQPIDGGASNFPYQYWGRISRQYTEMKEHFVTCQ